MRTVIFGRVDSVVDAEIFIAKVQHMHREPLQYRCLAQFVEVYKVTS